MAVFQKFDRPNCCDKTTNRDCGIWFESASAASHKAGWVMVGSCVPLYKHYTLTNVDFCPYCGKHLPPFSSKDVKEEDPIISVGEYSEIDLSTIEPKLMVYSFDTTRELVAIRAFRQAFNLPLEEVKELLKNLPIEVSEPYNKSIYDIFALLSDAGFNCCMKC